MNINNQPIRIRQQKRRVLRHLMHIQHHPRHLIRELRRTDLRQKSIIGHRKALARQLRRQPCMVQIEEDAIRILHPRRLILHVLARIHVQVDRHTRIARRRPMPNPGHHRQRPRLLPLRNLRNHPPLSRLFPHPRSHAHRLRLFHDNRAPSVRIFVSDDIRVPHLRDGFIVDKVGIVCGSKRPPFASRRNIAFGYSRPSLHTPRILRIHQLELRLNLARLSRIIRRIRPQQLQRLLQRSRSHRSSRIRLG